MFRIICLLIVILTGCTRQVERHYVPQGPLVVIDAGHGGKDEGCAPTDVEEKGLTLETAQYLRSYLHSMGYRTLMTRRGDNFVDLDERVALANEFNGDLFVSLHFNAAESKKAKGVEVFYFDDSENIVRSEASKMLADSILGEITQITGAKSRGVKSARFRVIRNTHMPAVLVEGGFLTNAEERAIILSQGYLCKLALGIARGVDNYVLGTYPAVSNRPRRELNARPAA